MSSFKSHIVTGGYDKTVRLFDVNTGAVVKTFQEHQLAVTKAIFNPLGNLIISGYANFHASWGISRLTGILEVPRIIR